MLYTHTYIHIHTKLILIIKGIGNNLQWFGTNIYRKNFALWLFFCKYWHEKVLISHNYK